MEATDGAFPLTSDVHRNAAYRLVYNVTTVETLMDQLDRLDYELEPEAFKGWTQTMLDAASTWARQVDRALFAGEATLVMTRPSYLSLAIRLAQTEAESAITNLTRCLDD